MRYVRDDKFWDLEPEFTPLYRREATDEAFEKPQEQYALTGLRRQLLREKLQSSGTRDKEALQAYLDLWEKVQQANAAVLVELGHGSDLISSGKELEEASDQRPST